jgi:hypothetical protein
MDQRLFPVEQRFFEKTIQPIIEKNYIWKGRPPKISHYKVFCAIMYVLRTVGYPGEIYPNVMDVGIQSINVLKEVVRKEYGGRS